jgi:homotetrameric cytidine deaminase
VTDLSAADRELIGRAAEVSRHAYVPASHFAVGAALRTASGAIHVGCNVENASYGLTICAERAAVAAAVAAEGPGVEIAAIAVSTDAAATCSPCGACRQVIAELGPRAAVLYQHDGRHVSRAIAELLPDAFTLLSGPEAKG